MARGSSSNMSNVLPKPKTGKKARGKKDEEPELTPDQIEKYRKSWEPFRVKATASEASSSTMVVVQNQQAGSQKNW